MPGDNIHFKGWKITKLSFDAVKGEVEMVASRDTPNSSSYKFSELYVYTDKIDFIYGLEHFLTNLSRMTGNHNPETLREDIKDFLREHKFLMTV